MTLVSVPSAGHLSGSLAERREARQARSRPWAEPPKRVAPRRTQTGTPHLPPATRGPPARIQKMGSGSLMRSAMVTSRQAKNVPAKAVSIHARELWQALRLSSALRPRPPVDSARNCQLQRPRRRLLPCTRDVNKPWNQARSMSRLATPPWSRFPAGSARMIFIRTALGSPFVDSHAGVSMVGW